MTPLFACGDGGSGDEETGECIGTEGGDVPDGAWEGQEDWTDPGEEGNDQITDACGWGNQSAHHCFTTAIHAVHMHTGEIVMFHGEQDQRVWKIGTDPESIEWHPNLLSVDAPVFGNSTPDMFCTGHAQLSDGRVFFAGGNLSGAPLDGGLVDTFVFDPVGAAAAVPGQEDLCSFGWQGAEQPDGFVTSTTPKMQHDRWYPTLTMLRDGRILIAGGYSRVAGDGQIGGAARSRLLELYDPADNTVVPLSGAQFPVAQFPIYPQMFLLPNGDVFYAGSEDATNEATSHGRFLIIDYDAEPAQWQWDDKVVTSEVTGGSAVMYAPGMILKSGGPTLVDGGVAVSVRASFRSERIDLSTYASGDYDDAPDDFPNAANMTRARHFHNLTVLPNGKVLAVGGNSLGNGQVGENPNFPCSVNGTRVDELSCNLGCPSVCVDLGSYYDAFAGVACGPRSPSIGCSLLNLVTCNNDFDCAAVLAGATCSNSGRCSKPCASDADCGELSSTACSPGQLESPVFLGMCNPGNNACYATHEAEIYDPECNTWTQLDAQQFPRMYHSSALLVPDGRVLSMGGGHRQAVAENPVSEYFQPYYASNPNAPRPVISFGDIGDVGIPGKPLLPYGGILKVKVTGPSPARFTLIRLGATTHGFDMDQRFLELEVSGTSAGNTYEVQGPSDSAVAPPGYYMLFALSSAGQPSIGKYVRVGDGQ